MKYHRKKSQQLDLFTSQPTAQQGRNTCSDTQQQLPILYPRKVSYSSLFARNICPRRYFWLYPGNWWGWDLHAPDAAQKAYWRKRLTASTAWTGTLVHDFVERLLWNEIDGTISHTTGVTPIPCSELENRTKERFEREWRQSRQWTWDRFKKVPRHTKPVWLTEHESGLWPNSCQPEDDPQNIRKKRQCWMWVKRSMNAILKHKSEYWEHTPFNRWLIIEGHRLDGGLIIHENHIPQAQSILRDLEVYPEWLLEVDGEVWAILTKPDLMVCTPDDRYLVIDFKTGSPRHWRGHRKQLELYAACLLASFEAPSGFPAITEENLFLRAVYTNPYTKELWKEWPVQKGDSGRFLWDAKKLVRLLRRHHLRLDELDEDERGELRTLLPPRLFSGPEGLYEPGEKTIRKVTCADALVALPSLFPPTQAQKGNVKMCAYCECLQCCNEGKELISLAAKN